MHTFSLDKVGNAFPELGVESNLRADSKKNGTPTLIGWGARMTRVRAHSRYVLPAEAGVRAPERAL